MTDLINHPSHYEGRTIEPIHLCERFGYILGNVIKYVYRAGKKDGSPESVDLGKAQFYTKWMLEIMGPGDIFFPRWYKDMDGKELRDETGALYVLLRGNNPYLRALFRDFDVVGGITYDALKEANRLLLEVVAPFDAVSSEEAPK